MIKLFSHCTRSPLRSLMCNQSQTELSFCCSICFCSSGLMFLVFFLFFVSKKTELKISREGTGSKIEILSVEPRAHTEKYYQSLFPLSSRFSALFFCTTHCLVLISNHQFCFESFLFIRYFFITISLLFSRLLVTG